MPADSLHDSGASHEPEIALVVRRALALARLLAAAVRRRARRTAVGAVAVVVLLGGGVAWAVQDRVPRAGVVDTPAPSPTPTTAPTPVETDEAKMGTQPLWDPFTLMDSPRAGHLDPCRARGTGGGAVGPRGTRRRRGRGLARGGAAPHAPVV